MDVAPDDPMWDVDPLWLGGQGWSWPWAWTYRRWGAALVAGAATAVPTVPTLWALFAWVDAGPLGYLLALAASAFVCWEVAKIAGLAAHQWFTPKKPAAYWADQAVALARAPRVAPDVDVALPQPSRVALPSRDVPLALPPNLRSTCLVCDHDHDAPPQGGAVDPPPVGPRVGCPVHALEPRRHGDGDDRVLPRRWRRLVRDPA